MGENGFSELGRLKFRQTSKSAGGGGGEWYGSEQHVVPRIAGFLDYVRCPEF
jgi:hypothetical protein